MSFYRHYCLHLSRWWYRRWIGWWFVPLAVAVVFVFLSSSILAATQVGQQVLRALRFALGLPQIVQYQPQPRPAVFTAGQVPGLAAEAHQQADLAVQPLRHEPGQLPKHTVRFPATPPLATFKPKLQGSQHRIPHETLARHTQKDATETTVALTLDMTDVPTDIVVMQQSRAALEAPPSRVIPSSPRSQVAIVIDDLGWESQTALALLALDIPLSFAILPGAPYQLLIAQEAQRRGRDILLHLPMEPHGYPAVNPGRNALLSHMTASELATHVEAALQIIPVVIGVNNHMGSRLTESRRAMRIVMQQLKERDLFFLDSRTSSRSLASRVAREMGVRTAQRHLFLDHEVNTDKIVQNLYHLAEVAHLYGNAIGIGHPHPETLWALQHILPTLRQAGVEFVPISSLVK